MIKMINILNFYSFKVFNLSINKESIIYKIENLKFHFLHMKIIAILNHFIKLLDDYHK